MTTPLLKTLTTAALALATTTGGAATTLLFDPAQGVTAQWLGCGATGSVACNISGAGLSVSLGALSGMGGLSNYPAALAVIAGLPALNAGFPVLDRALGYRLDFSLDLQAEQHASVHRAGFSITLIGNDLQGIEIGFQQSLQPGDPLLPAAADASIFAQADGLQGDVRFNRAESTRSAAALAALNAPTHWALQVQGDAYQLMLADSGQVLLGGALRNYSAQTGFGSNAYKTPNFLFAGDNTSSAAGSWVLSQISLTTPVPEPGTAMLALAGGLGLMGMKGMKGMSGLAVGRKRRRSDPC